MKHLFLLTALSLTACWGSAPEGPCRDALITAFWSTNSTCPLPEHILTREHNNWVCRCEDPR